MRGFIRRISDRVGRHRADAVAADSEQLRYVLTDEDEDAKRRCLVSFLGEVPDNVAEVIATVLAASRKKGEFPVVVMSELRPDLIAAVGVPIEFLPTRRHLPLLSDTEYQRYLERRWALILAKWEFSREIELAQDFDLFLSHQCAPPGVAGSDAGQ